MHDHGVSRSGETTSVAGSENLLLDAHDCLKLCVLKWVWMIEVTQALVEGIEVFYLHVDSSADITTHRDLRRAQSHRVQKDEAGMCRLAGSCMYGSQ